jgi:hypothetical protein
MRLLIMVREIGEDPGAVRELGGIRKYPKTEVEALELLASKDVGGEALHLLASR